MAVRTRSHELDETVRSRLATLSRMARLALAEKYAAEKDVLSWGQVLFPEKFPLPFCLDFHGYLVSIRHDEFTSTEGPRYHSKTTIKCFLVPIFQALNEPETFRHYLNVQFSESKSLDVNRSIKFELELNQDLIDLYGNVQGERWTDQQFVLKNGVVFSAVGAGQSIRGVNYRNARPDCLIVDDLYDKEDINNPENTLKKNAWFWGSLYPARAQSRRCAIHVQGTAINPYDLLEELKTKDGVKSKTFKAITDWDRQGVLWPELNTWDTLMRDMYRMGSLIFLRELQNERREETTAIVKRSWLYHDDGRNWEYDPIEFRKKISSDTIFVSRVLVGNDPSIGKDSESDATGTALVLETKHHDDTEGTEYWVESLFNAPLSLEQRIQQLKDLAKDRPAALPINEIRIEAVAGFDDYATEVIRRTNLPVQRIAWVKDKITTLENKSHYFENGKVHLNKNIDSALKDALVHQLTTNHPQHDDLRDGVLLTLDDHSGLWNFVS